MASGTHLSSVWANRWSIYSREGQTLNQLTQLSFVKITRNDPVVLNDLKHIEELLK